MQMLATLKAYYREVDNVNGSKSPLCQAELWLILGVHLRDTIKLIQCTKFTVEVTQQYQMRNYSADGLVGLKQNEWGEIMQSCLKGVKSLKGQTLCYFIERGKNLVGQILVE